MPATDHKVGAGGRADDAAPGPARSRPHVAADRTVLAVIAAGGILGAEARYGISSWLPHRATQLPLGTWLVNVSGCFLIGALMVVLTELSHPHPLARPFLGVGVLGGYTTFSTAMVEVQQLGLHGRPGLALGYLAGTLVGALAAAALGTAATRSAGRAWVRRRTGASRR